MTDRALLELALKALSVEPRQRNQWTNETYRIRARARVALRDALGIPDVLPPSPATSFNTEQPASSCAASKSEHPALRLVVGGGVLPTRCDHLIVVEGQCLTCEFAVDEMENA